MSMMEWLTGMLRSFYEHTRRPDMNDDLKPGDAIAPDDIIYVINNSNSNKKFQYGDERVMLTAPGTPLSIQSVSHDMLRSPGFLAMWTDGRIRVSKSPAYQQHAVTESIYKARKRKQRMDDLEAKVQYRDSRNNGQQNAQDVSYKFKPLVSVDTLDSDD